MYILDDTTFKSVKVSNVIKVFDYKYSEIHNLLKILNLLNTKTLLFIMNL